MPITVPYSPKISIFCCVCKMEEELILSARFWNFPRFSPVSTVSSKEKRGKFQNPAKIVHFRINCKEKAKCKVITKLKIMNEISLKQVSWHFSKRNLAKMFQNGAMCGRFQNYAKNVNSRVVLIHIFPLGCDWKSTSITYQPARKRQNMNWSPNWPLWMY